MKEKTCAKGRLRRYFSIIQGVKLPWLVILCSFAFSTVTMTTELQVASLTAGIIDTSQKAIDGGELMRYVAAVLVAAVFTILGNYFTRRMEESVTLGVRTKLWKKIMHLPARYYDADNGDSLVTRVTSDASAPADLFSLVVSFVVCIVTTVQGFLQLFAYNAMLATYSLLVIPLTLLVCIVYGKLQFRLGVYSATTTAGSMAYLAERVRNFRLIKSAAAERLESRKGNGTFKEMYKADFLNWLMVAGYQLASGLFSILFIVVVFVIGGQLVPKGEATIGDLTGFYMVTGIVSMQLMQFFMNVGAVSGAFGSMKKMAEIMDMDDEPELGQQVPQGCADLVFDHVSFSYQAGEPVLRDLSLRIPAGKVTAVIGGNGAGKSTLFKLIARLYEPESGEIRFGNENIRKFSLTNWRDQFAYVSQKDPLIGGTVRENIVYGLDRQVTEEELAAAAKQANCYDCIMEKPQGFDEDVGLGGSNFSGGQGQCISIARAMLRDPRYLLLDEATSNLDVVSEALVTQAMDKLMEHRTTIMIAHSFAATRNADYVIVMKEGTVEAAGTPEELQKNNEFYRMFSKTL